MDGANNKAVLVGVIIALAALCAVSDYLLKRASMMAHPFLSGLFIGGMLLYAASAYGWVYVLRWSKLSTIGAIYSVVLVILLALVGVFGFSEKVSQREMIGLLLACASIILLSRFT